MRAWLRTLSILTAVVGFAAPCLLCYNRPIFAEEIYIPKVAAAPTVEHHDGGGDASKPITTPASPDTQAETTSLKPSADLNNGPVWFGVVAAVLCVVVFLWI